MTQTAGAPALIVAPRRLLAHALTIVAVETALLFLYTGVDKWSDMPEFRRIVISHGLIGEHWATVAGTTLACVEVGVGVLSLMLVLSGGRKWLAPVFIAQATLFLGFAVYAAVLTAQPPPKPTSCGCGALSAPTADWRSILTRSTIAAACLGAGALVAARCRFAYLRQTG